MSKLNPAYSQLGTAFIAGIVAIYGLRLVFSRGVGVLGGFASNELGATLTLVQHILGGLFIAIGLVGAAVFYRRSINGIRVFAGLAALGGLAQIGLSVWTLVVSYSAATQSLFNADCLANVANSTLSVAAQQQFCSDEVSSFTLHILFTQISTIVLAIIFPGIVIKYSVEYSRNPDSFSNLFSSQQASQQPGQQYPPQQYEMGAMRAEQLPTYYPSPAGGAYQSAEDEKKDLQQRQATESV